jgi:hypothetical protein
MLLKYLNLFLQNYFYRKVAKVNPIKNVLSRKKKWRFSFLTKLKTLCLENIISFSK